MERRTMLRKAEGLVREDKLAQAAELYQRLVEADPGDLVSLNKAGDLFARVGRTGEAVSLFERIGESFAAEGFYPKAIAIYKKILKIEPSRFDVHERLGDLYGAQNLLADAASHYRKTTELLLRSGQHEKARTLLGKLVRLSPNDAGVRRLLAETCELAEDGPGAAEAWIQLATSLVTRGSAEEAVEGFCRALRADPHCHPNPRPIAEALTGGGEGLALLDRLARKSPDDAGLVLLRAEVLRQGGRAREAAEVLRAASDLHPDCLALAMAVVRSDLERGDLASVTRRMDHAYLAATEAGRLESLCAPLAVLAERLPEDLSVAERLVEATRAAGDQARLEQALERLAKLHDRQGAKDLAAALRKEAQRGPAPTTASAPEASDESGDEDALAVAAPETGTPESAEGEPDGQQIPAGAAPAPEDWGASLTSEEREFLNEHLTEAEVFHKYGLLEKAIEQLEAVVRKFPSHREAHNRLKLAYLDTGRGEQAARECRRLARIYEEAGDAERAERESREARRLDPAGTGANEAEPQTTPEEIEIDLAEAAAGPKGATEARGPEAGGARSAFISLDRATEPAAAQAAPTGEGTLLDLADELRDALAEVDGGELPEVGLAEEPQSFDDVFAAFQESVSKEVDSKDFRTHYDLGIAYKEMGLFDEAIREFQQAGRSRERFLDCCSMLALLFREKGMPEQAEEWYRRGLDADGYAEGDYVGLRYELAELCAERGRIPEARDLYSQVFGVDADYRQVREKLRAMDGQ